MLFWGETCHWGCWWSRVSVVAGDFRHCQQNAAVRCMSVSNIHVGHFSWNILNAASWHVTVDQFKHCSHGNSSLLLTVNPCQGCGYMVSWTVLIIKCTSGTCKTEHELDVCQINVPSAGSHFRRSMSNSLGVNYSLYNVLAHLIDALKPPGRPSCPTSFKIHQRILLRLLVALVSVPGDQSKSPYLIPMTWGPACMVHLDKISNTLISNKNRNMQNAQQEVYFSENIP